MEGDVFNAKEVKYIQSPRNLIELQPICPNHKIKVSQLYM